MPTKANMVKPVNYKDQAGLWPLMWGLKPGILYSGFKNESKSTWQMAQEASILFIL